MNRGITNALHAPCDHGMAQAPVQAPPAGTGVLITCVLASSLAFIDGSVVNVGLPAIGKSLAADGPGLSWVIDAYLLPLGALLLLAGAAGDRFGRRKVLMAGIVVFAVASVLCAGAPTIAWLNVGRLMQGTGAAFVMPNSLAILGATFSGEARGRAVGIWSAFGAAAGAISPLLGGWLVDQVGWRAIFLINVPIASSALLLAIFYVHQDREPARQRLDWLGAVLITAGLASFTWGLTEVSQHLTIGPASVVVAGLLLLGLFLLAEWRQREHAMMPLTMFRSMSFVGISMMTFLLYGALGGLLVLLPFFLIETIGYSATGAGAALLPIPVLISFASPTMGKLSARYGPRLPLTIGPLIVAAGLLLTSRIHSTGRYWTDVLPAVLVVGIGLAGAVAPLTAAVLACVDEAHIGVASGFNSAAARTGGLVVTALLSGLLSADGAALASHLALVAVIGASLAAIAGACACLWIPTSCLSTKTDPKRSEAVLF